MIGNHLPEVGVDEACSFGVLRVDADARVAGFDEKPALPHAVPGRPGVVLASMGVHVFRADFLYRELCRDAADDASSHDFGADIMPGVLSRARVRARLLEQLCGRRGGAVVLARCRHA